MYWICGCIKAFSENKGTVFLATLWYYLGQESPAYTSELYTVLMAFTVQEGCLSPGQILYDPFHMTNEKFQVKAVLTMCSWVILPENILKSKDIYTFVIIFFFFPSVNRSTYTSSKSLTYKMLQHWPRYTR